MSLLEDRIVYKPFLYPWAYDSWLTQQRIHWLPEEVPLAEDVKDWHKTLTVSEKNLLTQIFRFFVQADVEVNNCYMKHYSQVFKPTEVQMMLSAFSNMETIHIAAYSHLLDTIGMPEVEYEAFLKYGEMKDKYDYMQEWGVETKTDIAKTLAVFGGFKKNKASNIFQILEKKVKPGGKIFIVEAISNKEVEDEWSFRTEEFYKNLFNNFLNYTR